MTTHKERVDMFLETLDIGNKIKEGIEEVSKYEVLRLLSCFRGYIVELDLAIRDLDTLKTQLNSNQSIIDNKEEEN